MISLGEAQRTCSTFLNPQKNRRCALCMPQHCQTSPGGCVANPLCRDPTARTSQACRKVFPTQPTHRPTAFVSSCGQLPTHKNLQKTSTRDYEREWLHLSQKGKGTVFPNGKKVKTGFDLLTLPRPPFCLLPPGFPMPWKGSPWVLPLSYQLTEPVGWLPRLRMAPFLVGHAWS